MMNHFLTYYNKTLYSKIITIMGILIAIFNCGISMNIEYNSIFDKMNYLLINNSFPVIIFLLSISSFLFIQKQFFNTNVLFRNSRNNYYITLFIRSFIINVLDFMEIISFTVIALNIFGKTPFSIYYNSNICAFNILNLLYTIIAFVLLIFLITLICVVIYRYKPALLYVVSLFCIVYYFSIYYDFSNSIKVYFNLFEMVISSNTNIYNRSISLIVTSIIFGLILFGFLFMDVNKNVFEYYCYCVISYVKKNLGKIVSIIFLFLFYYIFISLVYKNNDYYRLFFGEYYYFKDDIFLLLYNLLFIFSPIYFINDYFNHYFNEISFNITIRNQRITRCNSVYYVICLFLLLFLFSLIPNILLSIKYGGSTIICFLNKALFIILVGCLYYALYNNKKKIISFILLVVTLLLERQLINNSYISMILIIIFIYFNYGGFYEIRNKRFEKKF